MTFALYHVPSSKIFEIFLLVSKVNQDPKSRSKVLSDVTNSRGFDET